MIIPLSTLQTGGRAEVFEKDKNEGMDCELEVRIDRKGYDYSQHDFKYVDMGWGSEVSATWFNFLPDSQHFRCPFMLPAGGTDDSFQGHVP